jgi:phage tail-like protein
MANQTLLLQLTPMQIPEAFQPSAKGEAVSNLQHLGASTQQVTYPSCEVLVYPREPSEIVLQLQNLSSRNLRVDVRVEGSFPPDWCRVRMEGQILAGRSQMDAVVYFQIPGNFFENNTVLPQGQSLRLDYPCLICVYYTEEDINRRLVETVPLNVYVRTRSLYLNYLPALYREVDFIGRFLQIFEQAFEPAVQSMDTLWAYLDPMTAPQALLPFLAHWVAWPIDHRWNLSRQRLLIRYAVELYRWRGTTSLYRSTFR